MQCLVPPRLGGGSGGQSTPGVRGTPGFPRGTQGCRLSLPAPMLPRASARGTKHGQPAGRSRSWTLRSQGDPSKGLGRSMSLVPVCWHTAANERWAG